MGSLDIKAQEDKSRSEPINLGPEVNSPTDENRPFLTLDGRYLFFVSDRRSDDAALEAIRPDQRPGNGSRDIYWVDAGIIDKFRPVPGR